MTIIKFRSVQGENNRLIVLVAKSFLLNPLNSYLITHIVNINVPAVKQQVLMLTTTCCINKFL